MNYTQWIVLVGFEYLFSKLEQMLSALVFIDFEMMVAQVWLDTTSIFNFFMVSVIFITGFKKKI